MKAPTPTDYAAWVEERKQRTIEFMKKHKSISGKQVKDNNLSIALICKEGYVYNSDIDALEKKNG